MVQVRTAKYHTCRLGGVILGNVQEKIEKSTLIQTPN